MDAPCKDCKDRHDICWKDCDKYLRYKKEREEIKEKISEEKKKDSIDRKRVYRRRAVKNALKNKKSALLS